MEKKARTYEEIASNRKLTYDAAIAEENRKRKADGRPEYRAGVTNYESFGDEAYDTRVIK